MLGQARDRAEAFAQRHRGSVAELGAEGLAEAMHELAAIHDLAGRAGSYAMLSFSLDTADPVRGALLQKARELGATIETTLLFFELEWNLVDDERAGELLGAPELAFCAHYLTTVRRYRPHQLSEPEERILTETSVNGPGAFARLFTEQTSGARDRPARPRRPCLPRGSALATPGSRSRAPRRSGDRRDRGAQAQPAHALVRVQHPAGRQGREGPAALLPPLAGVAQPGQRGQRRVGGRADRGGALALRHRPALVRAEGQAARAGATGLLRPHGPGVRQRRGDPVRRGPGDRARLLRELLPGAGRGRGELLLQRLHRRPTPFRQARRRLLLVHRAVGAPVRAPQLHLTAARRADDGARAGARRPRLARPASGRLPLHHPAHARGDRLDLRRDDRARAPAPARARGRPSASTCWPEPSTARWGLCFARWP